MPSNNSIRKQIETLQVSDVVSATTCLVLLIFSDSLSSPGRKTTVSSLHVLSSGGMFAVVGGVLSRN